jgi:hypothetical protein
VGQGEDEVEVSDREQLLLPLLKPALLGEGLALGAVTIAAGVVAGELVATGIAAIQVAAESGGTTPLDQRHHLQLIAREAMLGSVAFSPEPKDVGYLPPRPALVCHRSGVRTDRFRTGTGEHCNFVASPLATRWKGS